MNVAVTALPELLQWHAVEAGLPDAELTVLMWVKYPIDAEWTAGFWDGEDWRYCESGGVVNGTVTHWAQPDGPQP